MYDKVLQTRTRCKSHKSNRMLLSKVERKDEWSCLFILVRGQKLKLANHFHFVWRCNENVDGSQHCSVFIPKAQFLGFSDVINCYFHQILNCIRTCFPIRLPVIWVIYLFTIDLLCHMQVTIHGGEYNISAQGKLAKLLMVCDCVMASFMVRYHIFWVVEKVG